MSQSVPFYIQAFKTNKIINEDFVKELEERQSFSYQKDRWHLYFYISSHKQKYNILGNSAFVAKQSNASEYQLFLIGPQEPNFPQSSKFKKFQFFENPESLLNSNDFELNSHLLLEFFYIELDKGTYLILLRTKVQNETTMNKDDRQYYIINLFSTKSETTFKDNYQQKIEVFENINVLIDEKLESIDLKFIFDNKINQFSEQSMEI